MDIIRKKDEIDQLKIQLSTLNTAWESKNEALKKKQLEDETIIKNLKYSSEIDPV